MIGLLNSSFTNMLHISMVDFDKISRIIWIIVLLLRIYLVINIRLNIYLTVEHMNQDTYWYYVNKSDNIKVEFHAFNDNLAVLLNAYCFSNSFGVK